MTGPEHYKEAERLLNEANVKSSIYYTPTYLVAKAQVHATLALAAATAYPALMDHYGEGGASREWANTV